MKKEKTKKNIKEKSNGFWTDSRGNKSSKRLWGSILMSAFLIFSTVGILFKSDISNNQVALILSIAGAGTSLLGIGTFEKIGKK